MRNYITQSMNIQDVIFFSIKINFSTSLFSLEDTANKKKWRWNKLTLQQTVDVIVCTLYNPGEFYCQISNNSGKFLQLLSSCIVSLLPDLLVVIVQMRCCFK